MTEVRLGPTGPFEDIVEPIVDGLSAAVFVDPNTTLPLAEQTGSAVAPYSTIEDALIAVALGRGGGAVLLTPATYPAETLVIDGFPVTLRALSQGEAASCDLSAVTIETNDFLAVVGVAAFGAISSGAPGNSVVLLQSTRVLGDVACGTLTCELGSPIDGAVSAGSTVTLHDDSNVLGGVTCDGSLLLRDSNVEGSCQVGGVVNANASPTLPNGSLPDSSTCDLTVVCNGYQVSNLTCASAGLFSGCQIANALTVGDNGTLQFRLCQFGPSVVITGTGAATADFDNESYASFLASGGTLVGVALLLTGIVLIPPGAKQTLDGTAPFTFNLLPAGHQAGWYLLLRQWNKRAAATAGTMTATLNYTDPVDGAQSIIITNGAVLIGTTGFISVNQVPILTDGTHAVTLAITFAGVTGTPSVEMQNSIMRVG